MFKVECEGCNAPYQVDERRVPPTGLKMRCPKCGASFVVHKPGEEEVPLPALAGPKTAATGARVTAAMEAPEVPDLPTAAAPRAPPRPPAPPRPQAAPAPAAQRRRLELDLPAALGAPAPPPPPPPKLAMKSTTGRSRQGAPTCRCPGAVAPASDLHGVRSTCPRGGRTPRDRAATRAA